MENVGIIFMVIWNIVRPFGIFLVIWQWSDNLVYFSSLWYIVQRKIWQPCIGVRWRFILDVP
jgi:hypothetical protein